MSFDGWLLILAFAALVAALARPMGAWLFALYDGRAIAVGGALERGFYRVAGVDPREDMGWRRYAVHVIVFSVAGTLLTYTWLRLQDALPLNPNGMKALDPHLAMNTAVSFVTNTNWQSYSGESTMSNLSQMAALATHNFLSAAAGIAVAFAVVRGFARREASGLGNFWVDLTRVTLYLLLPACIVYALVLVAGGVPQTFAGSVDAATLEGARQTLALGPVASQEAIKMFGTNGGGFFNANSAHPFENPSAWTNLLQLLSIFAIPAGLTHLFGRAVGDRRQGWAIFAAMLTLFRRRRRPRLLGGSGGQPHPPRARAPGRQHGGARRSASASPPPHCSPPSPPTRRAAR